LATVHSTLSFTRDVLPAALLFLSSCKQNERPIFTGVIFIYTSKTNEYYSHSLYRVRLKAGRIGATAGFLQGMTPAT